MSEDLVSIKNRLKILHNKTACVFLQSINELQKETFDTNDLRGISGDMADSTTLITIRTLLDCNFLRRIGRGLYSLSVEGKNFPHMLEELQQQQFLALIRAFKNPDLVFLPLFGAPAFDTFEVNLLVEGGLSRASSYRILKKLTDVGLIVKNEDDKRWKLTTKMDELKGIILQLKELSAELMKTLEQIKQDLPIKKKDRIQIFISSIEGLPVQPTIDTNLRLDDLSATISAEINIATNFCKAIAETSSLKHVVNIIDDERGTTIAIARTYRDMIFVFLIKEWLEYEKLKEVMELIDQKLRAIDDSTISWKEIKVIKTCF